jgi:bifunctional UDP-N-acetylglucosamine pyrophosphorylase/glucosamine-1-phosphate N-acetyltransferase
MRSTLPKVLHPVGQLPLVVHVLKALRSAGVDRIAAVVGPGHEKVAEAVRAAAPEASVHIQAERRGTAHAVLAGRAALANPVDDVIVVFGDTPFVSAETVSAMRGVLAEGAAVVVGGMRPESPFGYGRLITKDGQLVAIREEKDASEAERAIGFCNGGIMALAGATALEILTPLAATTRRGSFISLTRLRLPTAAG